MTIFGARGAAAMIVKLSLTVTLCVLSAPQATQAQLVGKVHRLGFLGSGSAAASANVVEAFRDGLRDLGWTEGQNIVIDYRFAENRFDRLPDLAAELVRLKVNLI